MIRRELTDAQWRRIERLVPGKKGDKGRSGRDNRLFVDAVLWLARAGAPWRDLPREFGHWNSGLAAGRAVTVWNGETGHVLVRAFADRTSRVDVSLLLRGQDRAGKLLMGLDDGRFLSSAEVRNLGSAETHHANAPAVELAIRQSKLTEVDHLEFDHPVERLQLVQTGVKGQHKQSALSIRTRSGAEFVLAIPSPYSQGLAAPLASSGLSVPNLDSVRSAQVFWRGKQRQFVVLSHSSGRTEILTEYNAPSTYDLATGRDDLLAQVTEDGRRVTLYQRSVPILLGAKQWVHDHEARVSGISACETD